MKFLSQVFIFTLLTLSLVLSQKDSDEGSPYEFGFTIDGEQHRHEKKDDKGIIQGEFGFITADGVYHVTVYATDENGNFKILSMRNIRISAPLDGSPATGPISPEAGKYLKKVPQLANAQAPQPQGPAQAPQTQQQFIPTEKPKAPYAFTTQPTIKPACGGCGYVTTAKPVPGQPFPFQNPAFQKPSNAQNAQKQNPAAYQPQTGFQNTQYNQVQKQVTVSGTLPQRQSPVQVIDPRHPEYQNNQGQTQGNLPPPPSSVQNLQTPEKELLPPGVNQQHPSSQNQIYGNDHQPGGGNPPVPNALTIPESDQQQGFSQGPNPLGSNQQQGFPQGSNPPGSNQQQGFPKGPNPPGSNQQQGFPQGPNQQQQNFQGQQPQQNFALQNGPNPTGGFGAPNPAQQSGSVSSLPPISVDKNVIHVQGNNPMDIPIKDKFPGMTDGLPEGVEEKDIKDLLYKFHYTVGFHGHYEKGLKNGAKIGGYFVNGRDGFSRVVTYVADENGFRPKFKLVNLGLDSDETPKEGSEKTFGLKSFEFVWYPVQ